MYEMVYMATEGFALGMIFAWALLLLMGLGLAFLFVVFLADGIYGWFDNRANHKQKNSFYSN